MAQLLMTPPALKRPASRPLDPFSVLKAAFVAANEVRSAIAESPDDFEGAIALLETVVHRFRSAFLAQAHNEADVVLMYHKRSDEELRGEFVPLYYRRAVLENVVSRYERSAGMMLRAMA